MLEMEKTEREPVEIATLLFDDKIDVEGQQIFSFKLSKKRNAMAAVAANTPKSRNHRTENIDGTEKRNPRSIPETPYHIRASNKKYLLKLNTKDASDEDYSEDENQTESESNSDDYENIKLDESPFKRKNLKIPVILTATTPSINRKSHKKQRRIDSHYVLQSDNYFSIHANSKNLTSNHTLDRLKTPRLPHDEMFKLLLSMSLSSEHDNAVKELQNNYTKDFKKWIFILNEGFNILLYGLGSKRNLLSMFHREMLSTQSVIVINGFFPAITIKNILDTIINDILDLNIATSNHHEAVNLIEREMEYLLETHLFLLIHNIDGVMLRSNKAQNILSRLAKIINIHLVATIDHINTPLLWDQSKLSNYNFSWWDVTTMLPYSEETAFENSLLVQNSGTLALSSMKNVCQSLTVNARGIYMLIVKNQLANKGNPNYQGMAFKDLYWGCREAFLVSSDTALRAQLIEFLDHRMVKAKRSADGTEYLNIPIEDGLLQQFMEEQEFQSN